MGRLPYVRLSASGAVATLALVAVTGVLAAPPSHARFAAQADAICTEAAAQTNALPAASTAKQTAVVLGKAIVILQHEIKATLALPAPAADVPSIRLAMGYLTQVVGILRTAQAAANKGDHAAYEAALKQAGVIHVKARNVARKLGLKVCGT
jgi:hypothetical protein